MNHSNESNQSEYYIISNNYQLVNKLIPTNYVLPSHHPTHGHFIKNHIHSFNEEDYSYNQFINKSKKYIKELQNVNADIKYSER
jgi:hypothetical protein